MDLCDLGVACVCTHSIGMSVFGGGDVLFILHSFFVLPESLRYVLHPVIL